MNVLNTTIVPEKKAGFFFDRCSCPSRYCKAVVPKRAGCLTSLLVEEAKIDR
jgi:hypothetical protein